MDGDPVRSSIVVRSTSPVRIELRQKLVTLRDALASDLVERDDALRLALLAMLAGEHLLLLGPPGTGKSLVARRLARACADARYFERLLTRFTVPEELFGPLSIRGLEDDRYERLTTGYLPTASIAFLDEVFKANSAILNALLTLLNERQFDNGTRREKTPLLAVVGASNELGEEGELDALYDRFLVRLHVGPVSSDAFRSLLALRGEAEPEVPRSARLTLDDITLVQREAEGIAVPDDVVALLAELRDWCTAERIAVSDRRWRKIVKLLQVAAFTDGREAVSMWDCWLLQHCVWSRPEQREKVYEWYAARVGASAAMDPSRVTKLANALEAQLSRDRGGRSQMQDRTGALLYRASDGALVPEPRRQLRVDGQLLYQAPTGAHTGGPYQRTPIADRRNGGAGYTEVDLDAMQVRVGQHWFAFSSWPERAKYLADRDNHLEEELPPAMEITRHRASQVRGRLEQLDRVLLDVEAYEASIRAHVDSLEAHVTTHLWVPPELAPRAARALHDTLRAVTGIRERLARVRRGFEELPQRDDDLDPLTAAPEPAA